MSINPPHLSANSHAAELSAADAIADALDIQKQVAEDIMARFLDQGVFDKQNTEPSISREKSIAVVPNKQYSSASDVLGQSRN